MHTFLKTKQFVTKQKQLVDIYMNNTPKHHNFDLFIKINRHLGT